MKNLVIKVKWLKREAIIILICYLIANLFNIIAIARYGTAWDEILEMQIIVLFIAEWLYFASIFIRLLLYGFKYIKK
jgi:hypothetical protein